MMFPFGPFVQVMGSKLGDFFFVAFLLAQQNTVDPVGGPVNRWNDSEIQHVI